MPATYDQLGTQPRNNGIASKTWNNQETTSDVQDYFESVAFTFHISVYG